MPRKTTRSKVWRVMGATVCAIALWGFVSLSNTYEHAVDLPLRIELPTGVALTRPAPALLRVQVRATGWTLLKTMVGNNANLVVRPRLQTPTSATTFGIGPRELIDRVRMILPDAQQINVYPDSVMLAVGPVSRKRVPLVADVKVAPRKGFRVIGQASLQPDSVTLVGAASLLDTITSWPTQRLTIEDVHRPVQRVVAVGDTLQGIVAPEQRRVELRMDVQEVGERLFTDIPLLDRVTKRDTSMQLVLRPERVNVLLRGGVRDLSRLNANSILVYVEAVEGADTLGLLEPRVVIPSGYNLSPVRVEPQRIRYAFRREVGV